MSIEFMICLVLLGVLAGSLSGLLGIGGGVILVPSLVFVFGLSQHLAQGTTLALMVPPIGLLAAWAYYSKGHVDLRIAALVCLGFAAGGYLGAVVATGLSNALLERVFGVSLLLIALKTLAGDRGQAAEDPAAPPPKYALTWGTSVLLVVLGLAAGFASGLIGIGGGVLLVPGLVIIVGLSQHQAQGTTLALMVPPIGILAAGEYYRHGDVNLTVAGLICGGFVVGALLGARLANRLSSRLLSKVFAVSLILIAIKMLVTG